MAKRINRGVAINAEMQSAINAAVLAAIGGLARNPENVIGDNHGGQSVLVPVDDDGDAAAAGDGVYDANMTAEGWRFPATYRDAKGKVKAFAVNPNDRKAFMECSRNMTFGVTLTHARYDGQGNEKLTSFPATANLAAKQFSSGNHGIYGRVESVNVVLPNGDEFVLSGQVNLQLRKRNRGAGRRK